MKDMFNIVNRVKAVKTFKGIDSQGFESIVFIFKKQPKFELKTTKISSRIFERSNQFRLFISLIDDDEKSTEIFNVLTEDLLSCVENAITEQEVLEILASRFQYWSDLFKRDRQQMDEKWVQGFIGELWFLDSRLAPKIGINNAVKSWTGPSKASQDFIATEKIFEIKTRTQQSTSIRISNDNQVSINMYLVVIEVTKSSELSNLSINLTKLIYSIKKKIVSPETHLIFNEKLLELGIFPIKEAQVYDKFSYDVKSISYFEIGSDFPIIDHLNVPKAVVRYAYDLSLNSIVSLKTSEEEVWN